jgi:hypothetical protein
MTADQDVENALNGNNGPGTPALPWALTAFFYDSHLFGLKKDYAFPEGANVSSSRLDQTTSMAKLLTRARTMPDGNDYDLHDAVFTILKSVLLANPHINDNEPLSVHYKPTVATLEASATKLALDAYVNAEATKLS